MEKLFGSCQSDCRKAEITSLIDKLYAYDFTSQESPDSTDAESLDNNSNIEEDDDDSEDGGKSISDVTDSNDDLIVETFGFDLLKDELSDAAFSSNDESHSDSDDHGYGLDKNKDHFTEEEEEYQSFSGSIAEVISVPLDVQVDQELNASAEAATNNLKKPEEALFSHDKREERIDQICSFFDLKGNQIVADALFRLKECLVLEGDFVNLEILQVMIA